MWHFKLLIYEGNIKLNIYVSTYFLCSPVFERVGKYSSLCMSGAAFDLRRLGWISGCPVLRKLGGTYAPPLDTFGGGSIFFSSLLGSSWISFGSIRFHGPTFFSISWPDSSSCCCSV